MDTEFIDRLNISIKEDEIDDTIDLIFEFFDRQFWAGNFEYCAKLLTLMNVELHNSYILTALLSITFAAKKELGVAREDFVKAVRLQLENEIGSERANRIVSGLI